MCPNFWLVLRLVQIYLDMSLTFPWLSDHPLLEICGHPFKQMPASSWNTNVHVAAVLGSYEKLNFSIFLQGLSIRKDGFELPCVSVIHRLPLQSLNDLGLVEVLGPLLLTTASATKRQNKFKWHSWKTARKEQLGRREHLCGFISPERSKGLGNWSNNNVPFCYAQIPELAVFQWFSGSIL